jgi:hypothetical protein
VEAADALANLNEHPLLKDIIVPIELWPRYEPVKSTLAGIERVEFETYKSVRNCSISVNIQPRFEDKPQSTALSPIPAPPTVVFELI